MALCKRELRPSLGVSLLAFCGALLPLALLVAGCSVPSESDVIGGLPCDQGKCASGFYCDDTNRCQSGSGPSNGGSTSAGGALAGGSSATGGQSAGGSNTGGVSPTGGTSTGGAGTGGVSPTGGATSSGGASTGGSDTGGVSPTGGATSSGGVSTGGFGNGGTGGSVVGPESGAPDASAPDASVDAGAPRCDDRKQNGAETGLDCGGPICAPCAAGGGCLLDFDCQSFVCAGSDGGQTAGTCLAPSCSDGTKNGTETDKDCGGKDCTACASGKRCLVAKDCTSATCQNGLCIAVTCVDARRDGFETDVDCGGPFCTKCAVGKFCGRGSDCTSNSCNTSSRKCSNGTCKDGFLNNVETGVDCGGGQCTACPDGDACLVDGDCVSGACVREFSTLACGRPTP